MESAKWQVYRRRDKDLLTHLRAIRGFDEKELTLDFERGLHDPNLLPGMKEARSLVKKARKENWPVTIFGDYDADGTPAAALLSNLMERLELRHNVIIPTRQSGYGLRKTDVEEVAKHSKLLITVDTGIASLDEIKLAKKLGLAVIVLDHHLPKEQLPTADALIDPYIPESIYPFKNLCGCALAYKLIDALSADFPGEISEGFRKWSLDLVAISTVADMMAMKGENRTLVHYGLKVLRQTKRPGLRALMAAAGLDPVKVSAGNLGFNIGPRLNASGRMGDNWPAFQLLTTKSDEEAARLAGQIEKSNRERQAVVDEVLLGVERSIWQQNNRRDHIYVVVGENWPSGVVGLAAGKISARYNRPAIILTAHGAELTGSGRSIEAYSLIEGLDQSAQYLSRYGGHRTAAGLSLAKASLPKFVDSIKSHVQTSLAAEQLVATKTADAILEPDELNLATAVLTEKLAPFGLQNPTPSFVVENVNLGRPRSLGASGAHLKWQAELAGEPLEVIGFGISERYAKQPLERAHLLVGLEANHWNNQTRLQLKLIDYLPTNISFTKLNIDDQVEKTAKN